MVLYTTGSIPLSRERLMWQILRLLPECFGARREECRRARHTVRRCTVAVCRRMFNHSFR